MEPRASARRLHLLRQGLRIVPRWRQSQSLNPLILDVDISDLKGDALREVSTPTAPPLTDEERIEAILLDAGVKPTPALIERLDDEIESRAIARAAEFARRLIRSMPGSAAAAAM